MAGINLVVDNTNKEPELKEYKVTAVVTIYVEARDAEEAQENAEIDLYCAGLDEQYEIKKVKQVK